MFIMFNVPRCLARFTVPVCSHHAAPLNNPPKTPESREKPELQSPAKLLLESWNLAHPEHRRPKKVYTIRNIGWANQLHFDGFTIQDVSKMTTDKINNRTGDYTFEWLVEDLRDQRKIQQATAPANGGSTDQEVDEWLASRSQQPEPASDLPANHNLWLGAYGQLKTQLDTNAFERVRNAKLVSWEGDIVTLAVPTAYDQSQCQGRLYRNIKARLSDAWGKPVDLRFEVAAASVGQGAR